MGLSNDIMNWVKKQCRNDDTCIMLSFVLLGILLCMLYNNQISGFSELEDSENNNTKNELSGDNKQNIGLELKPRGRESVPDSLKKQMEIMDSKPKINKGPNNYQNPKINIQDSSISKSFDGSWNQGYAPLDILFKGVNKEEINSIGAMGPMGPDRPMKPNGGNGSNDVQGAEEGELNMILLYAPWCGHSKKMLPDYEKVKSDFDGKVINGKKINIKMYNSDVDEDKVKEYGVKGFPSLYVEKDGVRESFPHRTHSKISEYLNNI